MHSRGSNSCGLGNILLLVCCVAAAGCCAAVSSIPSSCALGCPHEVAIVCGDDGHDYQSACLAVCQGVRIVHGGPCEDLHGKRPGALRLHRMLQSAPAPSGHARILQQQPLPYSSASSTGEPLLQAEIHAFKHHGFRLVGRVKLADATEVDRLQKQQTDSVKPRPNFVGHPGQESQTIRALRITPAGLLYAATYDREALEAELRGGSQRQTATASRLLSQTGKKKSGGCTEATIKGWQHAAAFPQLQGGMLPQPENVVPGEDVVMSSCAQLPDMPPYNPWAAQDKQHNSHHHRRQLLDGSGNTTVDSGSVTVTTAAGSTESGSGSAGNSCPANKFPYTAVGQLLLPNNKACTGSLVGADAVLTAAHCVFLKDGEGGGTFTGITAFAAGRLRATSGVVDPDGAASWSYCTIFNTYEDVPDAYQFQWDVCIIRLAQRIGDQVGWLGMASGCAMSGSTGQPVMSYQVTTAGYPTSLDLGTCTTSTCSLLRDDCKARTCYHNCPSVDGQSGSPFFLGKDNRIRAILVGTINAASGPLKVAHVVGTGSYSSILKWVSESQASAMKSGGNDVTFSKGSNKASKPASSSQSSVPAASQSPLLNSTTDAGNIVSPSPSTANSTNSNSSPSPSPSTVGSGSQGSPPVDNSPSLSPSPDVNATSSSQDPPIEQSPPSEQSPLADSPSSDSTSPSDSMTSPSPSPGSASERKLTTTVMSVNEGRPQHRRRRPPPCKFLRKRGAC